MTIYHDQHPRNQAVAMAPSADIFTDARPPQLNGANASVTSMTPQATDLSICAACRRARLSQPGPSVNNNPVLVPKVPQQSTSSATSLSQGDISLGEPLTAAGLQLHDRSQQGSDGLYARLSGLAEAGVVFGPGAVGFHYHWALPESVRATKRSHVTTQAPEDDFVIVPDGGDTQRIDVSAVGAWADVAAPHSDSLDLDPIDDSS